jgi:hypothetical protein
MNERIRALAGQALDKVVPYTWTKLDYDEIQKLQQYFAELIVKECMNVVGEHKAFSINKDIREHFGIER